MSDSKRPPKVREEPTETTKNDNDNARIVNKVDQRITSIPKKTGFRVNGEALDSHSVFIDRSLFSDTYDEVVAQREACELIKTAVIDENAPKIEYVDISTEYVGKISARKRCLRVHGNELIRLICRERMCKQLTKILRDDPASLRDTELASRRPEMFWNIVHHVGGPSSVRKHKCSVIRACRALLLSEGDWSGVLEDTDNSDQEGLIHTL